MSKGATRSSQLLAAAAPARESVALPALAPSPGLALRDYAQAELQAAEQALGHAGDELHEGVHRARKGLRRARSALALGDGILGPGVGLLDDELKRINTGLSLLRDAHALVETLDRLLKRTRKAATRELLAQVRVEAVAAREARTEGETSADPGLGQRRALIRLLRTAVPALAWDRLTPSALRMALADSDERMQQARARAERKGSDDAWHRWRRRARRASQQRRAMEAAGLTIEAVAAFDKRTTERLGEAQDLTLLLDHCGRGSPFSKDERQALRKYAEPALERLRRRIATAHR